MDVDGMYENTPWERLALWAPWLGIGVVVVAIVLHAVARRREVTDASGSAAAQAVATIVGARGLALLMLGVLFVRRWRQAHDTYPHEFGRGAIGMAAAAMILALIVVLLRRSWRVPAVSYALLTAAAATAVAISAFSHSIIAEGQVTAMVLPVGYVVCAILADLIASVKYRDAILYEGVALLTFLVLAFVTTQLLPVVQFREDSSVYPVTGAFYIVALGRAARLRVLPSWAAAALGGGAIAIGYLMASWYGIAIAVLGLSISGALDPRRLPSAESPPPHLTPA